MEFNRTSKKARMNSKIEKPSFISQLPSTFSLENYVTNYSGFALIHRLLLLADTCPSLAQPSLSHALKEIRNATLDTDLYKDTHNKLIFLTERNKELRIKESGFGEIEHYNTEWLNNAEETYKKQISQLEADLNVYKASLVKNSVRIGLKEIAALYYKSGDFISASKTLKKIEECCVDFSQLLDMYYFATKIFIIQGLFKSVLVNYKKIGSMYANGKLLDHKTFLYACFGISNMALGNYYQAAQTFTSLEYSELNNFDGITSNYDIAIYGALCALAALSRNEIKIMCLESETFSQYLEHDSTISDMLNYFYTGNYLACSQILEQKIITLNIDVFVNQQSKSLLSAIQKNIIVHYIKPRITADLQTMYKSCLFNSVEALEQQLAIMISSQQIFARLDVDSHYLQIDFRNHRSLPASFDPNVDTFSSSIDNKLDLVQSQINYSKSSNLSATVQVLDSLLLANEQLSINRELNKSAVSFKPANYRHRWESFI